MLDATREDGYSISDDPARLDRDVVHGYLSGESYWARGRRREITDRSIDHSLCLGAYAPGGTQAGFARAVSDRATFAWLCDVFVLEPHRGRGLGVWLAESALGHPELASVSRWWLATEDAHALYARLGFTAYADPSRLLVLGR